MKIFSKMLYLACAVLVILVLTFGTGVEAKMIEFIKAQLIGEIEITDVSVSLESTELLAGKNYYPKYTPSGDFEGTAGLVYTSMNPEYLVVSSGGSLYAKKDFEGDSIEASVKITSKYDKDFEKIITYKFVKKYPQKFSVQYCLKGHSANTSTLYVGVPVYVYSYVSSSSSSYGFSDHVITYDENYFDKVGEGLFMPKRATAEGETSNFVVTYGNGASAVSKTFTIEEPKYQLSEIDEIKINGKTDEIIENTKGKTLSVTLFAKGELAAADYSLEFEDANDVSMKRSGSFAFKTSGDKKVKVVLANGFSKTFSIKVRNVMSAPSLNNKTFQETRHITMMDTENKYIGFSFKSGVTYTTAKYEYDKDMIQIRPGTQSFTIVPKKAGTTTIKMIVDDGFSRYEESYTVEITRNPSVRAQLISKIDFWFPKICGHFGMFCILAFFAMYMFRYIGIQNKLMVVFSYLFSGLWVAFASEFVQYFLPTRSERLADVGIDMSGFLLGTLLALIFIPGRKHDEEGFIKQRKL